MVNRRISSILFLTLLISISYSSAEDVDDFDDALVEDSPLSSPTSPPDIEPVIDIPYTSPLPLNPSSVYFSDHFDDLGHFHRTWVQSAARKASLDSPSNSEEDLAQYDGVWALEAPQRDALHGDKGLVLKSKAKHAAIAAKLNKVFRFEGKELVVQYEVTLQDGQECGGAYLKLLSEGGDGVKNLAGFTDKTPYTIMFGPDKCGNDHKLHFIFRHRNPLNQTISEKHCKKPKERLEDAFADKQPHLYTLIVRPDSTYEVLLDRKVMNAGSLLDDFTPSVNPPAEIEDVSDRKPVEWDEREKVGDPEAVKPAGWDEDAPAQVVDEGAIMPDGWLENEATHIADPAAIKPLDWDTEMDGEWEAPLIDNPQCVEAVGCGKWEPPLINNPNFKGKWRAPLIDNPNYKGKWRPRLVSNPDYYEDKEPYKMQPIAAIGFELWSMSKDILFDNLIITDNKEVADQWASETFDKKQLKIAKDSESVIQKLANITNEYPALWALYIVILGIPVVFVLYLCCKPSSSSASQSQEKGDERRSAEKKKTDEVTEDDVKEPQDGVGDAEEEKEEEEEEDDPAEKDSGPEDEEEESKEEVVPTTLKKEETAAAPRKRKARKE